MLIKQLQNLRTHIDKNELKEALRELNLIVVSAVTLLQTATTEISEFHELFIALAKKIQDSHTSNTALQQSFSEQLSKYYQQLPLIEIHFLAQHFKELILLAINTNDNEKALWYRSRYLQKEIPTNLDTKVLAQAEFALLTLECNKRSLLGQCISYLLGELSRSALEPDSNIFIQIVKHVCNFAKEMLWIDYERSHAYAMQLLDRIAELVNSDQASRDKWGELQKTVTAEFYAAQEEFKANKISAKIFEIYQPLWSSQQQDLLSLRKALTVETVKTYQQGIFKLLEAATVWCEAWLGEAPCDFALLAMGSYARADMGPYSDLDLAILVSDENYRAHHYFQLLIHFLNWHFKTLGEPWIWHNKIIQPVGLHIDAGDLAHLQVTEQQREPHLIQTPERLAEWVFNKLPTINTDTEGLGVLAFSLLQTTCIAEKNATSLLQIYQDKLSKKLTPTNCKQIALASQIWFRDISQKLEKKWDDNAFQKLLTLLPQVWALHALPVADWIKLEIKIPTVNYLLTQLMIAQPKSKSYLQTWQQVWEGWQQKKIQQLPFLATEVIHHLTLNQWQKALLAPLFTPTALLSTTVPTAAIWQSLFDQAIFPEQPLLLIFLAYQAGERLSIPVTVSNLLWDWVVTQVIAKKNNILLANYRLLSESTASLSTIIQSLIQAGANIDSICSSTQQTALAQAIQLNLRDWISLLLELGAGQSYSEADIAPIVDYCQADHTLTTLQALTTHNQEAAWYCAKQQLFIAPNQSNKVAKHLEVQGVYSGQKILADNIRNSVWDTNLRFHKKNIYGRREIALIKLDARDYYLKKYPESPGLEAASQQLGKLLFGNNMPYSELFKFYRPNGQAFPVLLSQGIHGINLQTVLNAFASTDKAKQQTQENNFTLEQASNILKQIDPISFSQQFILALLLLEEDGKPDNRLLVPLGNQENTQYRLISIDNDHILIDPIRCEKNQRQLQLKSIIFCLDQMQAALHPAVIDSFIKHEPYTTIMQWLTSLETIENKYLQLFSILEREQHLKRDSLLTVPLTPGSIPKLYQRWQLLRRTLQQTPTLLALDVLRRSLPLVGLSYQAAFNNKKLTQPLARFDQVCGSGYTKSLLGYQTNSTSSRLLLLQRGVTREALVGKEKSSPPSSPVATVTKTARACSPQAARYELEKSLFEKTVLSQITEQVKQGNFEKAIIVDKTVQWQLGFKDLGLDEDKAAIINALDWSQGILQKPDKQKQLLNVLKQQQVNFTELQLQNCQALTDADLEALLQTSSQLTKLTLINASLITDKIWSLLETLTPSIEHLQLQNLSKLTKASVNRYIFPAFRDTPVVLPQLKTLIVRDCQNFIRSDLEGPELHTLAWIHCSQLQSYMPRYKKLQRLLIQHCPQLLLKEVQQQIFMAPDLTYIKVESCSQLPYAELCSQFHTTNHWQAADFNRLITDKKLIFTNKHPQTEAQWQVCIQQMSQDLQEIKTGHTNTCLSVPTIEQLLQRCSNLQTLVTTNWRASQQAQWQGHEDSISCVTQLTDGRVVSGSYDRTLKIWDLRGQFVRTLKGHYSWIRCVTQLTGDRVVSGAFQELKVWDLSGECVMTWEGHKRDVWCVTQLSDSRVVSGSEDGMLKVWDLNGQCVMTWQGHKEGVSCITQLSDGRVVSGSYDRTLKVWDLSGQCVMTLEGHKDSVRCVTQLADGRVVSGSYDRTLKIWDLSGQCVMTWEGHKEGVLCVTQLTDGRVVSGSDDKTLKVWDLSGQSVMTWQGHENSILCLTQLSDGRVVSGSKDYTLKVWAWSEVRLTVAVSEVLVDANRLTVTGPKQEDLLLYYLARQLPVVTLQDNVLSCKNEKDFKALLLLVALFKPKCWEWITPVPIHYLNDLVWTNTFAHRIGEAKLPYKNLFGDTNPDASIGIARNITRNVPVSNYSSAQLVCRQWRYLFQSPPIEQQLVAQTNQAASTAAVPLDEDILNSKLLSI